MTGRRERKLSDAVKARYKGDEGWELRRCADGDDGRQGNQWCLSSRPLEPTSEPDMVNVVDYPNIVVLTA